MTFTVVLVDILTLLLRIILFSDLYTAVIVVPFGIPTPVTVDPTLRLRKLVTLVIALLPLVSVPFTGIRILSTAEI